MKASKILKNGIIYTLDGRKESAIAIAGDKILEVGSEESLLKYRDDKTQELDLKGRTVVPGFNDTHTHLVGYGSAFHAVDLSDVTSVAQLMEKCREFIRQRGIGADRWLYGRGWNQNLFVEDKGRFPTAADLDQISEEIPILLIRVCGHVGLANTKALKNVGVHKDTFIPGGSFDKDEKGKPNGVIREASLEWFKKNIYPKPGKEDVKRAILSGAEELVRNGVTSIHTEDSYDLGYGGKFQDIYDSYRELAAEGLLPLRVYQKVSLPKQEDIVEFLKTGLRTGSGDDFYKIGPVKQWCDGTMGARTAAMLEDYSDDPGNRGILVYEEEELYESVKLSHLEGMQMCLHAIGDRALKTVLDVYERVLKEYPRPHRHRIVHCQVGNKELYQKLSKLGININIQPLSTATDIPIMNARLGPVREKEAHNWRTLTDLGVVITGSSDVPVELPNVFYGIHAIVNRQNTEGQPVGGWLPEQGVTVDEALKMYTINSAFSAFEDDIKGTLAQGKLADLVLLDRDPYEIPLKELKDVRVLGTMVGGEFKYVAE